MDNARARARDENGTRSCVCLCMYVHALCLRVCVYRARTQTTKMMGNRVIIRCDVCNVLCVRVCTCVCVCVCVNDSIYIYYTYIRHRGNKPRGQKRRYKNRRRRSRVRGGGGGKLWSSVLLKSQPRLLVFFLFYFSDFGIYYVALRVWEPNDRILYTIYIIYVYIYIYIYMDKYNFCCRNL